MNTSTRLIGCKKYRFIFDIIIIIIGSNKINGKISWHPNNKKVRRIDEYTSLLAISNLETDHAGNYSCVATNSVAEYVRSAVLTIRGEFNQSYQKTMMNDQISGKYRYIVYR